MENNKNLWTMSKQPNQIYKKDYQYTKIDGYRFWKKETQDSVTEKALKLSDTAWKNKPEIKATHISFKENHIIRYKYNPTVIIIAEKIYEILEIKHTLVSYIKTAYWKSEVKILAENGKHIYKTIYPESSILYIGEEKDLNSNNFLNFKTIAQ